MRASALKYRDLPSEVSTLGVELQSRVRTFGYFSKPLIKDLSRFFSGRNVLEIYSGRGHLSALLAEQGINIKSTSLRSGHDCSEELGHVFEVENIDAVTAVHKYANWADALLVCWPTTDSGLFRSLSFLSNDIPIVFIGEITDYQRKPFPFLGGCATDEFFDSVEEIEGTSGIIRYPTPRCDQLKIYKKRI